MSADDFIALPCSHPDCATLTYMVRRDDGQYRSVVSMIGRDQLKQHMAVYGNRLAPDDALWEALTGLLSETALISRPELIDHLLDICEVCDLGVSGFVKTLGRWLVQRDAVPVEAIAKRVKRISVKTFMDTWTMNVERLQQCCVHVASTGEDEPGADPVLRPAGVRRAAQADVRGHGRGARPAGAPGHGRRRGAGMSTETVDHGGEVGPWSYPRRTLSRPEKYEKLAFTFCRMGTVGLIAWVLGPPLFVLIVAIAAVVLYARAITLGVGWTKCFLRRPTYIVGFWLLVAIADAYWLFVLGGHWPVA